MKGSMNDIWETRIRKEKVQKRKEKKKKEIRYRDTSYLPFRYREIHKGIQRIDMKRIGNEFKRR